MQGPDNIYLHVFVRK